MKVIAFQLYKGRKVLDIDKELTKEEIAKIAAFVAAITLLNPNEVLASSEDITEKISKASQPIKDLLIGIADPVCYIVFVWGLLECMLGKGSSGINRMKYAAIGYMGMNWLPVFMDIIRQAKP